MTEITDPEKLEMLLDLLPEEMAQRVRSGEAVLMGSGPPDAVLHVKLKVVDKGDQWKYAATNET